jgi:hypothetical protein
MMNALLVSTRVVAPRLLPGVLILHNSPFAASVKLLLAVRHFQAISKRLNDKVEGSGGVDNVNSDVYEELNEVKAKLEELTIHTKSTDRVLSVVMKHTHIPLQLTILVRYSYKLLMGNCNIVPSQKRIVIPHTIGQLNTPGDTEREIQSLTARITTSRKAYGSQQERPHEIAANMLNLPKRFKLLGLEGEHNVVWLAGEVCRLL